MQVENSHHSLFPTPRTLVENLLSFLKGYYPYRKSQQDCPSLWGVQSCGDV